MKDQGKTKVQLIDELTRLRQRIVELETRGTPSEGVSNISRHALKVADRALASSISAFAMADLEGNLKFVNASFLRMWGYDHDKEVSGRHAAGFWHDRERAEAVIGALLEKGVWRGELVGSRRDGSVFDVELSASVFENDDGKRVGMLGFFIDITERKRAEEALRHSEEKLRLMFESVADGITVSDLNGVITDVNDRMLEMLGLGSKEEAVGRSSFDFLVPGDRGRAMASKSSRQGSAQGDNYTVMRTDGSEFPVELSTNVLRDASGRPVGFIGVTRDITDRKRAEEAVQRSRDELRELYGHLQSVREEERRSIAREIHDELGQALTALKMDVSWLGKRLPRDREPLIDKTRSMLKIIDGTIRAVKRISTDLRPAVLDDLGLVAAIEWQATEFTSRTGIKCILSLLPDGTIVDREPSTAFFRILQEALTNVARHASATKVKVKLRKNADMLVLSVSDNGKGIDKAQISSHTSFGFIGIRERAYSLGGEAKFTGSPGKGTTVTVSVPARQGGEVT